MIKTTDDKENAFIGANNNILPNVTIGANTIVAEVALANKSIGEGLC